MVIREKYILIIIILANKRLSVILIFSINILLKNSYIKILIFFNKPYLSKNLNEIQKDLIAFFSVRKPLENFKCFCLLNDNVSKYRDF